MEDTINIKREILSWLKYLIGAFLFAIFITRFLIVNAVVPSGSMENTVMTGDRVICNRLAYLSHLPERYDIVVFQSPFPGEEEKNYFKRVIGLPGETLEIIDGLVYIDGDPEPLRPDFYRDPPNGNFGPYEIPEDCYFMMGDNRDFSGDSRYWRDPYIPGDRILGKAVFRYYPNPKFLRDSN